MTTFYTIFGAIVFWIFSSIGIITLLWVAIEYIWRKAHFHSYIYFLDYIVNRKQYMEWRNKKDAREKALKDANIKVTSKKKFYE